MRYIKKEQPPKIFAQWLQNSNTKEIITRHYTGFDTEKDANKKGKWSADLFANLQKPQKTAVWESLLKEQGGICAYCGQRLKTDKIRIEHLNAKSTDIRVSLEYSNLVAVCNSQNYAEDTDKHCDVKRGNDDLSFYPTEKRCETLFSFDANGHIFTEDKTVHKDLLTLALGTIDYDKDGKPMTVGYKTLIENRRIRYKRRTDSSLQLRSTRNSRLHG